MAETMTQSQIHSHNGKEARQSLAQNGRSFHFASHLLGRQMGDDAARLYAFCRVLDDLADGDIPNGPERLESIRLSLMQKRPVSDPALSTFMPVIQRYNLSKAAIIHLLDGLLADQDTVDIADFDSLIRYSYQVAGTVGVLMCGVMGCTTPAARAFAIDMGIAMQLTNIARDVYEDAQMGRRYLPASWTETLTASQILACAGRPDSTEYHIIQNALTMLCAHADIYYKSGEAGLGFLPLRARMAIAVAGRVYRRIGVKLLAGGVQWGNGRTITSLPEKLLASMPGLATAVMCRPPYRAHDSDLHTALVDMLAELDEDR